ncbi:MAG: hypothetical protein KC493_14050 [Bacteriovoracaceae bacterium]|nr:hypothetical protein [Bacteriovoracaceae bacterium]
MRRKSRMVSILFLIALSAISPFSNSNAGIYTIQDLEALEKSLSAQEYLEHALDIRPSLRDDHWKQMTQHMGVVLAKQLINGKITGRDKFLFIEKINIWPVLKNDEFFQIKREEFLKSYFKNCLSDPSNQKVCKMELLTSWVSSRKDPDRAVEYLGLFQNLTSEEEKMFLTLITNSKVSAFLCRKKIVKSKLVDHFSKKAALEDNPKILKNWIEGYLNEDCWNQVKYVFEETLMSNKVYQKEQAFKILNAKREISKVDRSVFLVSYILNVPNVGRIFNMAWNELNKLGPSHNYRKRVLSKLRTLDPLPGKLFHIINSKKKEVLLDRLNKNFPEYLDHYTKTCLDYLEGLTHFPRGNPTPNCQKLFNDKLVMPVINQGLKIRFSGLRK